jgi:hypothetical protein
MDDTVTELAPADLGMRTPVSVELKSWVSDLKYPLFHRLSRFCQYVEYLVTAQLAVLLDLPKQPAQRPLPQYWSFATVALHRSWSDRRTVAKILTVHHREHSIR